MATEFICYGYWIQFLLVGTYNLYNYLQIFKNHGNWLIYENF